MKNISVITNTIKIAGDDLANHGDVVFREVELHNGQPVFVIFAFSLTKQTEDISEKSAQAFETIINSLKTNISFGNLEALKTAFSEGLNILDHPHSSLVAVVDGIIYALTQGLGQVYLKRHATFAPIVHNPPLPDEETETQTHIIRSASGLWQENDTLILTSNYHPALKTALKDFNYKDADHLENTLREKVNLDILSQTAIGVCKVITLPADPNLSPTPEYDNLQPVDQNIINPQPADEDEEEPFLHTAAENDRLRTRIKAPGLIDILKNPRRAKKIYGLLTLVFIGILTVRLFLAFAGVTQESKNLQSEELLVQAQEEYQQALPLVTSNPPLARNKLISAQNKINNLLALTPDNQTAKILLAKIQESISGTLNVKDTVLTEFIKLDLIKSGATGSQLDLDGRILNVLDSQNGSLFQINIDRKSSEIVGGGDMVKDAKFIAGSLGRTFAYKDNLGIVRSTTGDDKTELVIDAKDQNWGSIGAVSSFSGNVYVLDQSNNQIWKYTPTESAFAAKTNYIKDSISRDISDGIDMSIDGSVWVLNTSETIYNFLPDSGTSFPTSGLDKKIGPNAKIYSDAESTDLVYVLDPDNSRVVAFGKTGGYRLQYQNPQLAQALDIAVSEKDQTIFLLTANNILALKI